MKRFSPDLSVLPPPQLQLWPELNVVPDSFTLYGGTAIALQLGHRASVDFDFFAASDINPQSLQTDLPFLRDAHVQKMEPNTLTVQVDRGGPVQVSFFGIPTLGHVEEKLQADDNNIRVASLLDLGGTKAVTVQQRAEAKDYIDIDALITQTNIDLPHCLAAASMVFSNPINPEITLKALTYFDEQGLRDLPDDMKERLVTAVRGVDLGKLPALERIVDTPAQQRDIDDGMDI